eukprot:TRINITY_DN8908_c0_g1_i3.p1 TRINITY_DN8908_c0_g1~~TRINITY_DN8908_c0_g1_i3.p1  ORF type:complete len:665 (-),score=157.15 TRINITY_DN8908_c0_g1_i3:59-2053(-)
MDRSTALEDKVSSKNKNVPCGHGLIEEFEFPLNDEVEKKKRSRPLLRISRTSSFHSSDLYPSTTSVTGHEDESERSVRFQGERENVQQVDTCNVRRERSRDGRPRDKDRDRNKNKDKERDNEKDKEWDGDRDGDRERDWDREPDLNTTKTSARKILKDSRGKMASISKYSFGHLKGMSSGSGGGILGTDRCIEDVGEESSGGSCGGISGNFVDGSCDSTGAGGGGGGASAGSGVSEGGDESIGGIASKFKAGDLLLSVLEGEKGLDFIVHPLSPRLLPHSPDMRLEPPKKLTELERSEWVAFLKNKINIEDGPVNDVGAIRSADPVPKLVFTTDHDPTLPELILDKTSCGFRIEMRGDPSSELCTSLTVVNDEYDELFYRQKHYNWIGMEDRNLETVALFSILATTSSHDTRLLLVNSCKGFELFEIPSQSGLLISKWVALEKYLRMQYPTYEFVRVKGKSSKDQFKFVESNHRQEFRKITVSFVYCKAGEADPMKMQKTQDSCPAFDHFLSLLGFEENTSLSWEGKVIYAHIATRMTKEQRRRLIGNCQAVVFFTDPGYSFDPSQIDSLGLMPQCYIVVQPWKDFYRVGFLCRDKIAPFPPVLPPSLCLHEGSIRNFIFTKMYNGYMAARQFPPISKLYEAPRLDTIQTISRELVPKAWVKKK